MNWLITYQVVRLSPSQEVYAPITVTSPKAPVAFVNQYQKDINGASQTYRVVILFAMKVDPGAKIECP